MTTLGPLLTGLLDYAGLFPPAALPMAEAVRLYDVYRRGPFAWALGRFVVPVTRLAEFSDVARPRLPAGAGAVPWRLSGLLGTDPAYERGEVEAFNRHHERVGDGLARVDALEARGQSPEMVEETSRVLRGFRVAFEVLGDDRALDGLLLAVKSHEGIAKLRTGGITPEAIPGVEEVSRFLCGCARVDVPLKFTAGLHHAVRGEHALTYAANSARGMLHGLLNVMIAAAAARRLERFEEGTRPAGGSQGSRRVVAEILAEVDPGAFEIRPDGIAWRGQLVPADEIAALRATFAVSVGTCSFEEPLDELRALWTAATQKESVQ